MFAPETVIVDWCTVTWQPDPSEHVAATAHHGLKQFVSDLQGEECPGMLGYEAGLRLFVTRQATRIHLGRADWGGQRTKGRARLDISGTGCQAIADWPGFAAWIGQLFEFSLTRIDLALDCLEGEYSVDDARAWYEAGQFIAGGRNPRHSTPGDWLSTPSVNGRTLEIGRRENGKMLRAYEKGKQLGDQQSHWTRWEVEWRNNDRELPIEMLTDRATHFAGAYPCLAQMVHAGATPIATHRKLKTLTLEQLVSSAQTSYGRLVNVLTFDHTPDEIAVLLSRPGTPRSLERSALGGNTGRLLSPQRKRA